MAGAAVLVSLPADAEWAQPLRQIADNFGFLLGAVTDEQDALRVRHTAHESRLLTLEARVAALESPTTVDSERGEPRPDAGSLQVDGAGSDAFVDGASGSRSWSPAELADDAGL